MNLFKTFQNKEKWLHLLLKSFHEMYLRNMAHVLSDSPMEEQWHNAVINSLPPEDRYRKVSESPIQKSKSKSTKENVNVC
ncbi:hypothetical protein MHBO_003620 [Bonamia ostreae]|uniref:Uncharacterized protein n=1 Tax=Bonamia ostreae TaxID=126728 RepID=A0ABV2AR08_9EUKA